MAGEEARIVVGVDGSDPAKAALRWAAEQADLTGARIDAVIAWEYPLFSVGEVLLPPHDPESMAARSLAAAVEEALGPDREIDVRQRVVAGHPARTLIDLARGALLLVVGNRGLGTFAAALLGSVAQYCVQHAPCPVVVVRGPRP